MDYENQKIVDIDIEREVKKSFMEYAMSVIVSRALPDVRDGLKPVQRRILYTMHETGLTPDKAYRKSVTAVGDVLGKYHPHGETSVYDAMVRMAQDFSLRYPLIDGHGNFGSVDGDPAAAYRYTEARMTRLSLEMLRDIDKETVDYRPNFDGTRKEPVVLPSRFPNLLVNGSSGIAVGMATNIPPHNLGEVVDATLYRLENPDCSMEELMHFVPGPDFPTGGVILGRSGIRAAYATGKGRIKVRAKAEIIELENGKSQILITEIPYMVNKSRLCENIGDLVKEKRIEGITAIRDETSRHGMRIVIETHRNANAQVILNQLYRFTQMEETFAVNMIALSDGAPKLMGLMRVIDEYLAHQKNIIVRRTSYDLNRALERAHILAGLRIAVDNIEEVIRLIRASSSLADAKAALMERFSAVDVSNLLRVSEAGFDDSVDLGKGLSEAQASAIVAMTLGQLTGLGVDKIEKEFFDKMHSIRECNLILSSEERIRDIIKEEMTEVKRRFGDERRTSIEDVYDDIDIEDLIEEENCVYTLTYRGYIKRCSTDTYRAQRRGGRGVAGMTVRDEDVAETLFVGSTHDHILFFTSAGRVYRLKGYQIPEAGRTAKGTNIVNLLQLEENERVTAMRRIDEFDEDQYLVMVTRLGTVKRLALSDLTNIRRSGIRALTLDENDSLIRVLLTNGNEDIIIGTKKGQAVRFHEDRVRVMGRTAMGVRGIRLADDDEVVGAAVVQPGEYVLTVTELGYGKLTPEVDFPTHNRGGKGVLLHNLTEKTGSAVAGLLMTDLANDLMMITSEGTMIRTPVESIRICGRNSQGVIVMRTMEGETVISLALTEPEEDEMEDSDEENQEEKQVEENQTEDSNETDETE